MSHVKPIEIEKQTLNEQVSKVLQRHKSMERPNF